MIFSRQIIPESSNSETEATRSHAGSDDRRQVLFDWNETWTSYPREACVHQLFEAQVRHAPQTKAVECAGEFLTYEQLNARVNELAHRLQSLGVGPEVLVGICLRPSLQVVVALLAILKAGGAYVPLESSYPPARLAFVARDSRMRVLITQRDLLGAVPNENAHVLCLDEMPDASEFPRHNPTCKVRSENLAYVIYTSGSTGTPKGVMVPHRGLVNYLLWAAEAYQVRKGTGAPVHSSLAFDLTITSLLVPLIAGRCVRMLPAEERLGSLATILRGQENFSLVKITPAHLELLCTQWKENDAAATRLFVVGGEALFSSSLSFWQKCASNSVLVNEYGPTETVVGCCVYFVPKDKRFTGPVPIGRPIANTQLYLLDENLQPVAIGETGELYIAGDGLARGYLNLPELTAEKFITNPFAADDPHTSIRMYKTGDLARYLPDGNLEYLGRIDDQIKLRSYRIEPAEIEAALCAHAAVRNAAVVAEANTNGDKFLVAYLALDASEVAPRDAELRELLKRRLPDFMIPTAFIALREFPLTANGKIDRSALSAAPRSSDVRASYIAPQTTTERRVAEIWRDTFQRPEIGLRDSFFEMGGHSLLAARLVTQINDVFSSDLDASTLLQYPTVETLARALHARDEALEIRLIPMHEGKMESPVFFLNAPFHFKAIAGLTSDRAVFASQVPLSAEALQAAARGQTSAFPTVAQMAAPHVDLICRESVLRSCVVAGFSYGAILAFEVAHQLVKRRIAVEAVILFDGEMKEPKWLHLKRRARRHLDNFHRAGSGYIWEAVGAFLARKPPWPTDEMPDLTDHVERWNATDRIWRHALKSYRRRCLTSRGILLRAEETCYQPSQDFDGALGWAGLFRDGLTTIKVPGEHHSMWQEPHVRALGQAWKSSVENLRRSASAALYVSPALLAALTAGG